MPARFVKVVAGAAIAAVLTSGCGPASESAPAPRDSGASSSVPPSPAPSSTPAPDAEPTLNTPLQAYRLRSSELATVSYARSLLIQSCMKRFGFDYDIPYSYAEYVQETIEGDRMANSRLYAVVDPERAARYGYGFPPSDKPDGGLENEPEPSAAYTYVISGQKTDENGGLPLPRNNAGDTVSPGKIDGHPIPAGGCFGEADRLLGTGDPNVSSYGLAHNLWIEDDFKLQASKAYRTAVGEWAACLAEEGYHVTSPVGDNGDIAAAIAKRPKSDNGLDGPPAPGEAELAVADVACKQRVRLVERLDKARAVIDQKAIDDNQLALTEDRKRLDAQVKKATQIVKDAGR